MTPNTPAGGAVAWSYEHNFGDDKWETRLTFSQPVESAWNRNIRPLAYAPATVPLVAKWRSEADRMRSDADSMREEDPRSARLLEAMAEQQDRDADELEALTRGEK